MIEREGRPLQFSNKVSKVFNENLKSKSENLIAPKNLRAIKFSDLDFKFSLKTLETLLENWRGRPSLSIITSDLDYEGQEYMEIINRYKDEEVLKDFKCIAGNRYCFYDGCEMVQFL